MAGDTAAAPDGTGCAIDVERATGPYRSANRTPLTDVTGRPVGELSLAPPLLIRQVMDEMRAAPGQAADDRLAALARAGELFATATLEGETPGTYCRRQALVSGLPVAVARRTLDRVARAGRAAADSLAAQRPSGAVPLGDLSFGDLAAAGRTSAGAAVAWVRKGDVLGVLAPGNHPATHVEWLGALALGYRVAVRPSQRDPFTPRRLVRALREAGLAPGYVALLPTTHEHAEALVDRADLGLVYGGDPVVARYAGSRRVLAQGPGRSKVLLTRDVSWRSHLDTVADSVAADAGVQCLNASAVLCEDDAPGLAHTLAERLARLPLLAPDHPDAALPVRPLGEARRLAEQLHESVGPRSAGAGEDPAERFPGERFLADLGDGSAVLRPVVVPLDSPEDPRFGVELPLPYAAVAPWGPGLRPAAFGRTLALTVLSEDADLVRECVASPLIRNTHWGAVPTHWSRPGLPHDGALAEFLMESKTFAGEAALRGPVR
ncbi:aldehyde dehydrogenase family protein [Streptomyces albofaciens JCM 4342]|uniref:aldehyde dehydrogenase family protein n=1 Tax=Streptomyces albofaciens TaxID=66866 RepID=UPI0012390517|nr:aldehyde dehydrogenase family protein [Streptomyces albofaciens]KAA6222823.1 aldehyde dehydrogenase family protein [Streptomyces albofaciens JCM 4342]